MFNRIFSAMAQSQLAHVHIRSKQAARRLSGPAAV